MFVGPAELVHPGALAAFRGFTAGFLNRDCIACDRVFAPDVALRIDDIERAVGLDRPHCAKRVGPRPG